MNVNTNQVPRRRRKIHNWVNQGHDLQQSLMIKLLGCGRGFVAFHCKILQSDKWLSSLGMKILSPCEGSVLLRMLGVHELWKWDDLVPVWRLHKVCCGVAVLDLVHHALMLRTRVTAIADCLCEFRHESSIINYMVRLANECRGGSTSFQA